MPTYKYSAMNEMGRTIRGNITADNDIDLEKRLKEIDLDLISFKEEKPKKAGIGAKVKNKDLIMMCLHLEQLNRAGVTVYDAIRDVRDSTDSLKLRDVLADMVERIKSGETLSDAMEHHEKIFGDVFVGLVRAGEANGDLTESFVNMTNHIKWSTELKRRIRKAIAYPAVLGVVMTIVIIILMAFVVPKLVDFMTSQGFDLPLHTRALIATSNFVVDYWWTLIVMPIVIFGVFKLLYNTVIEFAFWADGMSMKLPIIGPAIRKINMARFTQFFGVMFRSGIDILDALDAARDVLSNLVLKDSISTVIKSVTEGNSLTNSLRISNQFPNLVIRMFKVGEDSGNMNEALDNISYFYDREVNDAVDAIVGSIQPILTGFMVAIIFWIIAAVFGPLYESFKDLNF